MNERNQQAARDTRLSELIRRMRETAKAQPAPGDGDEVGESFREARGKLVSAVRDVSRLRARALKPKGPQQQTPHG
jgi:hypothetical protein